MCDFYRIRGGLQLDESGTTFFATTYIERVWVYRTIDTDMPFLTNDKEVADAQNRQWLGQQIEELVADADALEIGRGLTYERVQSECHEVGEEELDDLLR